MDTMAAGWLLDCHPRADAFAEDVLAGLNERPRTLPCKYFYDKRGSQLFDAICQTEEYYVTRTELAVMRRCAGEMAACIGRDAMLIELGSGSSVKTRLLLDRLKQPAAYVPVDISRQHLCESAARLARLYPHVEVLPMCADFTDKIALPEPARQPRRRVVYFPGSTIGNFPPAQAHAMLAQIAALCGAGGGLLIGIDLVKDVETLEAAYNDAEGVTAEFNLNLLRRINRELDGDFNLEQFAHHAQFNRVAGRMEIYLVSQAEQAATVDGHAFNFSAGERVLTEYSYKYTIDGFAALAAPSGLRLRRHWSDARRWFGVLYLEVE